MREATLKFNLDDPDDEQAHMRCIKSTDMALVIWEFAYNSHKNTERKLEDDIEKGKEIDPFDVLDMVFEEFNNLMEEHNVNIDELIY